MGWSSPGWNGDGWNRASGVAAFVGAGDIVSGASGWWGLRAYNAAYAVGGASPAVDLVDQGGLNPITINILANGSLDTASISAWVVAHTVTTIKVTKLYDQATNTFHLVQTNPANMPALVLNAIGTLPMMQWSGGGQQLVTASAFFPLTQPFMISSVFNSTGGSAYFAVPGGTNIIGDRSGVNTIRLNSGIAITATANDNAFHAVQFVGNSPAGALTSDIYVDGTPNVGDAGAGGATNNFFMGTNTFGTVMTGFIGEMGVWPVAPSNGIKSSLNSNQHSYWGFV